MYDYNYVCLLWCALKKLKKDPGAHTHTVPIRRILRSENKRQNVAFIEVIKSVK
jgi:hypothetical protein